MSKTKPMEFIFTHQEVVSALKDYLNKTRPNALPYGKYVADMEHTYDGTLLIVKPSPPEPQDLRSKAVRRMI